MRLRAAMALGMLASPAIATPAEPPIETPGPQGALQGTLTMAGAKAPVVLMIPGSGPTDRDGNSPAGVLAAPLRLLAVGLAEHGVSSVRIDKRGMFGSKAAIADANAVSIADYVADVGSWIGAIRTKTAAPCVWLLGHSEGALVALSAGNTLNAICGLILVAPAGRPIADVVREQLRANPANALLLADADRVIDSLASGNRVDVAGLHPALAALFRPAVQGYWIDMMRHDPAKLAARYRGPMLIVRGTRDIQVGMADLTALKVARPDAQVFEPRDANHVLKSVASDDPAANIATYGDPSLPLATGIVDTVAAFVKARRSAH